MDAIPARSYQTIRTPVSQVRDLVSFRPAGGLPLAKSFRPKPGISGKIIRRYSSTRSLAIRVCRKSWLPWTDSAGPSPAFRARTRVTTSPPRVCALAKSEAERAVGGDVFLTGGEGFAGLVIDLRPVAGENVVGATAKEEVEGRREILAHHLAHRGVPVVDGPSAKGEAAGRVLFVAAGACMTPSSERKGETMILRILMSFWGVRDRSFREDRKECCVGY